ncbi:intradiol ring-cleavage dioxygenase [Sphingosinicella sp.]|uniref:intradiol ring-cleavage dioxygenase n=1 Tax=Sphingosinicella sp. TaxID=1917971 RepID=UPI00403779AB
MTLIHRRELLIGVGAAGLGALPILALAGQRATPPVASSNRLIAGTTCPVTPQQTEGPFYFDPELVRADIAEGKPGVPLRLRLQIVDAAACAPSQRARVDLWHCDAAGVYSGYDQERSSGQRWLRGTQFADAEGVATFNTIYPGWYQGRATHIHLKAWMPDGREVTSQFYFPEELNDAVFREGPYAGQRGERRRNEEDGIFRRSGAHVPMAQVTRNGAGLDGAIVIALS